MNECLPGALCTISFVNNDIEIEMVYYHKFFFPGNIYYYFIHSIWIVKIVGNSTPTTTHQLNTRMFIPGY